MVLLCIQPALRVVGELCERLLRCPVIFAEYFLPVQCQSISDLVHVLLADLPVQPLRFELVLVVQLRDGLQPCPAYGVERPHGQVQICNIHLTNHVLSDMI
jgi:hypothetical protein